MNGWLYVLYISSLLMGCEACSPRALWEWEDKDFDFLIAKLESWNPESRSRATWYLDEKTEQRDEVIAALTHVLLNDTHERVRSEAARALSYMEPPPAEAVPALVEALYLPVKDRGKPIRWSFILEVPPLPFEVKGALESIGTPEALEGLEEWKKLGPKLIESSMPDGATGVDPDFINEHGITLRFSANTERFSCLIFSPNRTMWRETFTTNTLTLKPDHDEPKLGTTYELHISASDAYSRRLRTTITFTTKP